MGVDFTSRDLKGHILQSLKTPGPHTEQYSSISQPNPPNLSSSIVQLEKTELELSVLSFYNYVVFLMRILLKNTHSPRLDSHRSGRRGLLNIYPFIPL